jgi:hypothetical protein
LLTHITREFNPVFFFFFFFFSLFRENPDRRKDYNIYTLQKYGHVISNGARGGGDGGEAISWTVLEIYGTRQMHQK